MANPQLIMGLGLTVIGDLNSPNWSGQTAFPFIWSGDKGNQMSKRKKPLATQD